MPEPEPLEEAAPQRADARRPVARAPLAIAAICVLGVVVFAAVVGRVYAPRAWLAWRVLTLWAWVLAMHAACLGLGARVTLDWLRVRDRPALETLALSMAVGVVGWVLLLYVLGALGLYGTALVFVLPPPLIWAGVAPLRRELPRWRAEGASRAPWSPLSVAVAAFGVLALGLMYLGAFSPDALNYDSMWCHLPVAQDYAREGRIVPFPADYAENVPQLTPMLHLYGFLAPGLNQPLRWMFALHDEFALFLWTLVGVAAAVRWALARDGRPAPGATWAAYFLFPGLFVYDSNLGGAADHVLAFFAVPVLLATVRLGARPTRRNAILWGVVAGGALLTKYQAVYVIAPAAALIAGLWLTRRRPLARDFEPAPAEAATSRQLGLTALVAAAALALVVAPHFLRNLVFYANPVYPFMQDVFRGSRPTSPDAAFLVSHVFTDVNWQPKGTFLERLLHAGKVFFTFSFVPHYYPQGFHRGTPTFGSLFTLLLPVIPFLGRRPRLWAVAGCASAAVVLWALNFLVDRNLQTFLPWLVVTTAAVVVLSWRAGAAARLGLIPLVALQLVWGGDALFAGAERVGSAVDLIRSGSTGGAAGRFAGYRAPYVKLSDALPRDATVLLHASHLHLGIDRRVLLDWAGFQSLFDYHRVRSLAQLDALYRANGVTHIVREVAQRPAPTKQEEVLFALYVGRWAKSVGVFGGLELYALPSTPPPRDAADRVVVVGVRGYAPGVYTIDQLGAYETLLDVRTAAPWPVAPISNDPGTWPALVRGSLAVVIGSAGAVPAAFVDQTAAVMQPSPLSPNGVRIYGKP